MWTLHIEVAMRVKPSSGWVWALGVVRRAKGRVQEKAERVVGEAGGDIEAIFGLNELRVEVCIVVFVSVVSTVFMLSISIPESVGNNFCLTKFLTSVYCW